MPPSKYPKNVILIAGMSGVGKSTLAEKYKKKYANRKDILIIDFDDIDDGIVLSKLKSTKNKKLL